MDNFFLKKLSQKKIWITLLVLFFSACFFALYAYISITQNLRDMAAVEDVSYYPPYPATNMSSGNADLIKKGEYLTKAGDCLACHTNTALKEKSQPFAGGLAMITPFGTIYTPNLTPDKEHGIGKWSDDDFIKAMTKGISPTGHYYYPAFPFMYFNRYTVDDLKAIKAYLNSIPAVAQPNKDNQMMFPFNFRFLQLGWRILFFNSEDTGAYQNNPNNDAAWNRGAYLVKGAGHCAMCHTPSYTLLIDSLPLAAPIRKYDFIGAKVQGYLAPNISQSGIGTVSDADILAVFKEDKLIGGGAVVGPMKEVNHNSLRYLTDADLTAIATYLKTVQSQALPKPKDTGTPGEGTYDSYCSGCHATGGGGAPKYGDAASWAQVRTQPIDSIYTNAIKGINGMPAKGTCSSCSDTDIKQAVDYMLNSLPKDSADTMTAIKPQPKLTLADGNKIYTQNCSGCHNAGKDAPKPGDVKAWAPIIDQGFYDTYLNVRDGRQGHPTQGGCKQCSDEQLIAAVKYMMQTSATDKNYSLW